MDFDLNKFLTGYKPKKLDLTPYTKCSKLKNYHYLTINKKINLDQTKTYIKYIKLADAFTNKEYSSHIHSGGILLGIGTFINGIYKSTDAIDCSHLMLKSVPFPTIKDNKKIYEYDSHVFYIKLIDYYVFYRYF